MKKLFAALALCVSAAALAQTGGPPGSTPPEHPSTYKAAEAFDIQGTLRSASDDDITLNRQGLPEAELDVRRNTVVQLDGKTVKANELPAGAQVRAKFQLDGDDIVAVRVEAQSPAKAK
ncbi:hypothetical protein P2318_32125 [Myxococcaceae bacterium GXIMD 01537]